MFETSVVQARAKAAARHPLLFSLSIGAHAAAVVGIVTMSVAGVTLPDHAPNQLRIPIIASLPPMLGNGGAPKRAPAAAPPPQAPKRTAAPATVVAPAQVPDQVPQVATTQATSTDLGPTGNSTSDDTSGPGVPWGNKDIGVGTDGPPATDTAPAAKIYTVGSDVKAPKIIHRVDPQYPELGRRMRLNGLVILECIIDDTGHIRDVHILRASHAVFEQPALDAIRQWQFAPGTMNGVPVNVQFNLTVTFHLN